MESLFNITLKPLRCSFVISLTILVQSVYSQENQYLFSQKQREQLHGIFSNEVDYKKKKDFIIDISELEKIEERPVEVPKEVIREVPIKVEDKKEPETIAPEKQIAIVKVTNNAPNDNLIKKLYELEERSPEIESAKQTNFKFIGLGVYDTLTDKQEDFSLVSNLQAGLEVYWTQHWSEKIDFIFGFKALNRSYTPISSTSYTLRKSSVLQTGAEVNLSYNFTKKSSFSFGLGFGDQVYYQQVTEGSIDLIKDQTLSYAFKFVKEVARAKKLKALVHTGLSFSSGGRKDFEGAHELTLGAQLNYEYKKGSALGTLMNYRIGESKTTFTKFRRKELSFGLSWNWEF